MLIAAWLLGCTGAEIAECPDCPDCPETAPASGSAGDLLEPFEAELLEPQVQDLRKGVRPFEGAEAGFGVCQGGKECESFLGLDAGVLGAGDHMVRAELAVPAVGEGWQARFRVDCTVTGPTGKGSEVDHEKTYDLTHTGPKRGYSLQPLWRIQSPHPSGQRACTYSLTPLRPDGVEGEVISGSYTTPMPT